MRLLDVVYPDSPSSSLIWVAIVSMALSVCLFFVWREWKKNSKKLIKLKHLSYANIRYC